MKKPIYGNWMPKSMVTKVKWGTIILGLTFTMLWLDILFLMKSGGEIPVPEFVLAIVILIIFICSALFYRRVKFVKKMFDLDWDKSLSVEIVNFVANYMILEPGSKILDVGCGSGALTIAVAKRNYRGKIIGVDKWGGSYEEFSKEQCEKNAKLERVENTEFYLDNAKKLGFFDESFDGLVSNYVYHNIPGDKHQYILESLRVLKKGGKFAIHDIFSKSHYGNLEELKKKLDALHLEHYEFIDTTTGRPMDQEIASLVFGKGSKLLLGVK